MKLIKLLDTHYIIVDDSEIKKGNWVYKIQHSHTSLFYVDCEELSNDFNRNKNNYKKITHSTQPLSEDCRRCTGACEQCVEGTKSLSLLEIEETIYGYSVEKMALETYPVILGFGVGYGIDYNASQRNAYITGFKAHQELVKNKNKEVIKLLTNITEWSSFKEHPIDKQTQEALNLLLPKTEWDIEFVNNKIKLL